MGEDDDLGFRRGMDKLREDLSAVSIGEREVEQDDIRSERFGRFDRLLPVFGFIDHFDGGDAVENGPEQAPGRRGVVNQYQPEGRRLRLDGGVGVNGRCHLDPLGSVGLDGSIRTLMSAISEGRPVSAARASSALRESAARSLIRACAPPRLPETASCSSAPAAAAIR
jgi:hypothetical protein